MNYIDLARDLFTDLEGDALTIDNVVELTTKIAELFIEAKTTRVNALKLGLGDNRCGSVLLEGEYPEAIIADGQFSAYYAGFDYVDKSAITVVGRYTIYSGDDSRVDEHLDIYKNS